MILAIDLGGSTIDLVHCEPHDRYTRLASFESASTDKSDLAGIIRSADVDLATVERIALTGGHSRIFAEELAGVPVHKVSEIAAIGAGGQNLSALGRALVCSLGTGTCCVAVDGADYRHVGGTGVGGGSLLGLGRSLLQCDDFREMQRLIAAGNESLVDLSVAEIVGGGIGVVPGSATASNFAKAQASSERADLARGIANLVGQTIASIAVFAARAEGHDTIILGGKLVRVPEIVAVIQKTADIYERQIIVPPQAELMSAVGAGVLARKGSDSKD